MLELTTVVCFEQDLMVNQVSTEDNKFEQMIQKIDSQSKLLRTWKLQGGASAQITAIEIERADGQTKKMIVRQHGEGDLEDNPQIAADEFKLLRLLPHHTGAFLNLH